MLVFSSGTYHTSLNELQGVLIDSWLLEGSLEIGVGHGQRVNLPQDDKRKKHRVVLAGCLLGLVSRRVHPGSGFKAPSRVEQAPSQLERTVQCLSGELLWSIV